jgi:hypothetical protein
MTITHKFSLMAAIFVNFRLKFIFVHLIFTEKERRQKSFIKYLNKYSSLSILKNGFITIFFDIVNFFTSFLDCPIGSLGTCHTHLD